MSSILMNATNSTSTFQTALYLAIDKKSIFVNSKRSPQPIPIADFTLLL